MPTKLEVKFDLPKGFPKGWGVWRIFKGKERILSFETEREARDWLKDLAGLDNPPNEVVRKIGVPRTR